MIAVRGSSRASFPVVTRPYDKSIRIAHFRFYCSAKEKQKEEIGGTGKKKWKDETMKKEKKNTTHIHVVFLFCVTWSLYFWWHTKKTVYQEIVKKTSFIFQQMPHDESSIFLCAPPLHYLLVRSEGGSASLSWLLICSFSFSETLVLDHVRRVEKNTQFDGSSGSGSLAAIVQVARTKPGVLIPKYTAAMPIDKSMSVMIVNTN